jgi:hypothetical protein
LERLTAETGFEAFAPGEGSQGLAEGWAGVASITTLRIAATHHLFDHLLHVGPLIGRYLLLATIPPAFPMVDKDLAESVTTVLRSGMEQQESHFFACDNGQHLLTGINETAIMADRVFGLLSVVRGYGRYQNRQLEGLIPFLAS